MNTFIKHTPMSPHLSEFVNTSSIPNLGRSELLSQLSNAASMRSSEDQVGWVVFGTFWAANLLLVNALVPSGQVIPNTSLGVILSFLGIILCRMWKIIQLRSLGHIERYEDIICSIEEKLFNPSETNLALSTKINSVDRFMPKGKSGRYVMKLCCRVSVYVWLVVLVYFMCMFLSK